MKKDIEKLHQSSKFSYRRQKCSTARYKDDNAINGHRRDHEKISSLGTIYVTFLSIATQEMSVPI